MYMIILATALIPAVTNESDNLRARAALVLAAAVTTENSTKECVFKPDCPCGCRDGKRCECGVKKGKDCHCSDQCVCGCNGGGSCSCQGVRVYRPYVAPARTAGGC